MFSIRFNVTRLCYWIARTLCSTRRSPVFITVLCQWILRRMQAFMFASKAFSSHFSCFLVDEKHLHADLLLIKRLENSNWVSPKSKAMVKMIRKWTENSSLLTFWLYVLYFQRSTVSNVYWQLQNIVICHLLMLLWTIENPIYKKLQNRKPKGTSLFKKVPCFEEKTALAVGQVP